MGWKKASVYAGRLPFSDARCKQMQGSIILVLAVCHHQPAARPHRTRIARNKQKTQKQEVHGTKKSDGCDGCDGHLANAAQREGVARKGGSKQSISIHLGIVIASARSVREAKRVQRAHWKHRCGAWETGVRLCMTDRPLGWLTYRPGCVRPGAMDGRKKKAWKACRIEQKPALSCQSFP